MTERLTDTPWLTLVMPSFRGERWIDRALRSVADDSPAGIEILLVDGGPTAATIDIARRHGESLCLRIFERPEFTSWQAKANFGVAAATAGHVCLLPVDDLWLPGRAAAVRAWIAARPEVDLHLGSSLFIDAQGRRIGRWRCPLPSGIDCASETVVERLLVQNFVAAPAPVVRRTAWLASGGLDESLWYTADWDLWLKIATAGRVMYHETTTVAFRLHGASLTATGSRDAEAFAAQMRQVLNRHLPSLTGMFSAARRRELERVARTSIRVNCALAGARTGKLGAVAGAAAAVLGLGPAGMHRYLRDSRLLERLLPRLRARLMGSR